MASEQTTKAIVERLLWLFRDRTFERIDARRRYEEAQTELADGTSKLKTLRDCFNGDQSHD